MFRSESGLRSLRPRRRRFTTAVIQLESRDLLTTMVADPLYRLVANAGSSPSSSSLTPAQVAAAYGFNKINFGSVTGNGAGQTIAIVDAYSDPNIQSDLNTFDAQFGLPNITISQVNQTGGTALPGTDSTGGWEMEEALDVEWAHAIAPGANIILVAANSASDSDLLAGVKYASAHANVVSLSWGGGEFSAETSSTYENYFVHSGVVFSVSSGDNGAPVSWPASSPNVVAVGGTALTVGSGGTYGSETGWSGSGGGPSAYETRPSYQTGVVTQTTKRANPDVAYDASPNTGFAVYDSFTGGGGWLQVGGTSAGAPQWAALFAIADQGRALAGKPALNATDPQEALKLLYANAGTSAFHDIVSGTSGGSPQYSASTGYDYVTGLGSPVANLVVADLGGTVTAPATPDHFIVTTSGSTTAGSTLTVTVTAVTSTGTTDTAYAGTVHLTSSDAQAGLPANYTFVSANKGVATFSVVLKSAGSQSVTAIDTANSATIGTSGSITVSPAAASQLVITGLASSTVSGSSLGFTLTAKDAYGNVATGFTGTVSFTSSDASATLPASYTFTSADRGAHVFQFTLQTAGSQSITVSGVNPTLSTSQSGIAVSPAAPLSLTTTAASSTEIDLSWTSSTGATGYTIQRSLNGSTGWTMIGSTTTTTYQDTSLSSGTTYYYRVAATGGSQTSGYSNTSSATTSGSVVSTGTATSIWGSSYVPYENAYSYGSYDVGVKFKSDVAGTVSGVRFFKQSFMNGYTHVGYLWSSTGTLLAKATFTGETSSGWQQVTFSSPVAIAANTTYIVSFSTGGGYFGITTGYFSSAGADAPPLHALSNGASGGNGVYAPGLSSFPSSSGSGMNFWADVAFTPSSSTTVKKAATPATSGLVAPTGPGSAFSTGSSSTSGTSTGSPVNTVRRSIRPNVSTASGYKSPFGS